MNYEIIYAILQKTSFDSIVKVVYESEEVAMKWVRDNEKYFTPEGYADRRCIFITGHPTSKPVNYAGGWWRMVI